MEYIRRILEGNTGLFSYLVNGYAKEVYALIVKIVRKPEEAEELTQDVFMKVFNKLSTFKGDSRFSTWIYRIAYNTSISAVRRKRVEYPAIDEKVLNNVPDQEVDQLLNQQENEAVLQRLEKAITLLSSEEKALITLYYQQEMPVKELAEVTGLSEANVKIKLHRTRKKLYVMVKN